MLKTTRLFSEDGKHYSIGRLGWWVIFLISIFFWFKKPVDAFPPSLLHMLYVMTTYNLTKKAINNLTPMKEKIKEDK